MGLEAGLSVLKEGEGVYTLRCSNRAEHDYSTTDTWRLDQPGDTTNFTVEVMDGSHIRICCRQCLAEGVHSL